MKFIENNAKLEEVCRSLEESTKKIDELIGFNIDVELLDSFKNLLPGYSSIEKNPASYRHSENKILVNAEIFFKLSIPFQKITLMHEVGHAYLAFNSAHLKEFRKLSEELIADYLVCSWGFEESLILERNDCYGEEYSCVLRLWPDKKRFFQEIEKVYNKMLIGNN